MKTRYFHSAWEDIRHSPGWVGKILLLALINFVPIFGQIVMLSYCYGWAREIAWGIHEPAPRKIFANEDGKFWWRGWLIFVLAFAYGLIPLILNMINGAIDPNEVVMTFFGAHTTTNGALAALKSVLSLVTIVAMLGLMVLSWVGIMRVAIYNHLSAGFQLKTIMRMIRHDGAGLGRIFLMTLLFSFLFALVVAIVCLFVLFVAMLTVFPSVGAALYALDAMGQASSQAPALMLQVVLSIGLTGVVAFLVIGFLIGVFQVFVQLLLARALGYWTMQFNVPLWGGQDDPMPFELHDEPAVNTGALPPEPPMVAPTAPSSPAVAPQAAVVSPPAVVPTSVDAPMASAQVAPSTVAVEPSASPTWPQESPNAAPPVSAPEQPADQEPSIQACEDVPADAGEAASGQSGQQ